MNAKSCPPALGSSPPSPNRLSSATTPASASSPTLRLCLRLSRQLPHQTLTSTNIEQQVFDVPDEFSIFGDVGTEVVAHWCGTLLQPIILKTHQRGRRT